MRASSVLPILYFLSSVFLQAQATQKVSGNIGKGVHFFFYIWYGTLEDDGAWRHWDHEILPHWEKRVNKRFPTVGQRHSPPEILHSPYYPLQNAYSSKRWDILNAQFQLMVDAGGDVAVVSWWGQATKSYATDTQGVNTDMIMEDIFTAADDFGKIKICFHLEPYPSRSVESVREDLQYIVDKYGNHSSLCRAGDGRPLFYVYDSYHIFPNQWNRLLSPSGDLTVRNTELDGVFIGLWLEKGHGEDLHMGGFDGIYSYFATDGFSFGSTTSNWRSMCSYCEAKRMLCDLSVGPGYNDSSIRPWNVHNARDRRDGTYYSEMWSRALDASPSIISVTSFNEWGEGTQIEPARPVHPEEGFSKHYMDYGPSGPYKYIHLTSVFAERFVGTSSQRSPWLLTRKEGTEDATVAPSSAATVGAPAAVDEGASSIGAIDAAIGEGEGGAGGVRTGEALSMDDGEDHGSKESIDGSEERPIEAGDVGGEEGADKWKMWKSKWGQGAEEGTSDVQEPLEDTELAVEL